MYLSELKIVSTITYDESVWDNMCGGEGRMATICWPESAISGRLTLQSIYIRSR